MPRSFLIKKRGDLALLPGGQVLRDGEPLGQVNGRILELMEFPEQRGDSASDHDLDSSDERENRTPVDFEKLKSERNEDIFIKHPFDMTMRTPAPGVAMKTDKHLVGMDLSKGGSRSPSLSPSEAPKMFEPFPWQTALYQGYAPHYPYFPLSMRLHGLPLVPGSDMFPLRPYPEYLSAYNGARGIVPPPPFVPGAHFALPPRTDKFFGMDHKVPELNIHNLNEKLLGASYDRLHANFANSLDSSAVELDLSSAEKKKYREIEVTRYQCEGCNKSYSTFSGLSKHKQFHCSSHVKKEFSCKYCEKTYVSLGALKMHIRTHTLPCKCKLCGKAFSRPWLLQGHIRTHTGERPFPCPHCGRAFADRSNLRAHLQTHSDVKKYSCKTCNKTFSRMSLLLKHEDGCCGTYMQ